MQIDYLTILRRAYQTTVRQPGLWLLGLFLAGGFNANLLYLAQIQVGWRDRLVVLQQFIPGFGPGSIVFAGALTLSVFVLVAVIANWAKILFVLHASDALKLPRLNAEAGDQNADRTLSMLFKNSLHYIVPVLAISALTMISVGVITGILFGTPALLLRLGSQPLMWLLSAIIFTVLILFFSCLNIFSTFFIVLFRYGAQRALNLALDLIISRWQDIAGMAIMLIVIYGACFFAGSSLVFVFKSMASAVLLPLTRFGLANEAMVLNFLILLSAMLLWIWLALVNVFFNLSLLLLFAELVKPQAHGEAQPKKLPAAATGA